MPSLTFYGGVNEIGGNKILLDEGDTCLFFDFGISFGRRYEYFEEYLQPRSTVGLLDFLEMNLLPPVAGIYREDLLPQKLRSRFEAKPGYRELSLDGVVLSHAHLDHSGYISFLRPDIPIYATAMTAFITKAMQDTGKSDFEREVCYAIPKKEEGGLLRADRGGAALQRPFRLFSPQPLSSQALAFWQDTPSSRALQAQPTVLIGEGPLDLRCFPVNHSIFGAAAFAVETTLGWVLHTGDLRFRGGKLTEEFAEKASKLKPAVLLCEGTYTAKSSAVTEEEVFTRALAEVKEARALVIADFGPRNVERLLIFRRVAEETGRRLALSARDAYLLEAMHHLSPEIPDLAQDETLCIYKEAKAQLDRWEKGVRDRYRTKLVTPEEIQRHQDLYILCFSFFDLNEFPSLLPRAGSLYLYSSSEVFNEEGALDMRRLHNWLDHFGVARVGLPVEVESHKWEVPEGERGLHASGHASGPELLEIILSISPKVLIPIHTTDPGYFAQALGGTGIKVYDNIKEGETLTLAR